MNNLRWRVAAGLCWLLSITSAAAESARYLSANISSSGAIVIAQPKSGASRVGTLPPGAAVTVGERPQGGFYRITASGGLSGWVRADAVVLSGRTQTVQATRTARKSRSSAATSSGYYLGVMGGLGAVGSSQSFSYGAVIGVRTLPSWNVGLYFSDLNMSAATVSNSSGNSATVGVDVKLAALEIEYFLLAGLYTGIRLGGGIVATQPLGSSTSGPTKTYGVSGGAQLGYDLNLFGGFSMGAEANGFFLVGGGASGSIANLLGTLKYLF